MGEGVDGAVTVQDGGAIVFASNFRIWFVRIGIVGIEPENRLLALVAICEEFDGCAGRGVMLADLREGLIVYGGGDFDGDEGESCGELLDPGERGQVVLGILGPAAALAGIDAAGRVEEGGAEAHVAQSG